MALYEIIPITKPLQNAIKAEELEIDAYLKEAQIPQLKDHASRLIQEGITSIEEVFSLLVN